MISELLRRSLEEHCNLHVVIDHAPTCLFTLANKIQPPENPSLKIRSRSKLIVHRSLQQTNLSRCSVRIVLLLKSLHISNPSGATQSFAAHVIGCPMFAESSRNPSASPEIPEQPIRELECKVVEKPLFHSFAHPKLLSDPTPNVHTCVNSSRVSIGTATGTPPSPGIGICCAAAAASSGPPVNISTRDDS